MLDMLESTPLHTDRETARLFSSATPMAPLVSQLASIGGAISEAPHAAQIRIKTRRMRALIRLSLFDTTSDTDNPQQFSDK